MKTQTKQKIILFIQKHGKARAYDLRRELAITGAALHRQLKQLVANGQVSKIGKPPLVFYTIASKNAPPITDVKINHEAFINSYYLYISPRGEILTGVKGFIQWAINTKQTDLKQLSEEYVTTRKKANHFFNHLGWIDATTRFNSIFSKRFIDRVIYQDFYSLPKFGKTKLGQLVLYAKQSQNITLIKQLIDSCKPIIRKIISHYHVDAIAFIPPTIPRQIQLLKEFRLGLNINLPMIDLVKIYHGDVPIAQKSLSKIEERLINARETIQIKSTKRFDRVLIIDDAIGSGATIYETALKLKNQHLCKHIYAYAVVGSFKGFDVIREI